MKHWILLLLICLLQPLTAKRIALVIGNGNYDPTKPIHVQPNLKNTRSDSKLIATTFKKLGFENIYHLDGGFMAWEDAEQKVVK